MFKKTGFTLIIAQLIAYITCSINGDIPFSNIPSFIGFNFFAIIGIILLIKEYKTTEPNKKIKKEYSNEEKNLDMQLKEDFMKKVLIIVVLIIFSFIFVSIQSSLFVPMIVKNTQCECKPCTLEERLEKYINNTNDIEKNDAKVILLFMGYAWIVTLLVDTIIYNKIKNIQFKIITKNKEQQENDLLYKIIPITVAIGVTIILIILYLIPTIINSN